MTVATFFDTVRSDADIRYSGSGDLVPTLRGSRWAVISSPNTFVVFPNGTQVGDLAVFICSSPWDFNGSNSGLDGIRTEIEYIGGGGTPVSGWLFYLTVSEAMMTAGGVTLNAPSAPSGLIFVASFDGSENLSVSKVQSARPTGATLANSLSLGGANQSDYFMVFGAVETNTTIDLGIVSPTYTHNSSAFSGAAAIFNPSTRAAGTTITYGTSPGGSYNCAVRISRSPPDAGLSAASVAQATGCVTKRFISGPVYFEVTIDTLVGNMGPGIASMDHNYNNLLGTDRNSFFYQQNGQVRVNNTTLATLAAFAQGDRIDVAYHPGSRHVWFRVNGGSWNNDGTANPATDTGYIDVNPTGLLTTGAVFWPNHATPAVSFSVAGGAMTANFAEADFVGIPPAGFHSIEETVVGPAHNTDKMSHMVFGSATVFPSDWHCTATEKPDDNHSAALTIPAGPVKVIAGKVMEDSIGVEGKKVRLYNKRTGDYVGTATTDASGNYLIPAQEPNAPHFVVAFDDPEYNAKVFDNVMPG